MEIKTLKSTANEEAEIGRSGLRELFEHCPIPTTEFIRNLGLFMYPVDLMKLLFINDLYKKQLGIHGVIMEFGVRWGQNMALMQSLRAIYEPYNYNRKIIGFDTFEGFPSVHEKDGNKDIVCKGAYGVTKDYEGFLEQVLLMQEKQSPCSNINKFGLVKGDATERIIAYLKDFPETIISFAYFDFDIYQPTKKCLEAIKGHLTKGSIIGFDELNNNNFPGETRALKEVFGLDKYSIQRSPYSLNQSYIIV